MTGQPTGRRGQALAVALLLLVASLAWFGGVAPTLSWYAGRTAHLLEQQALASRMAGVAGTIPALQRVLQQAEPPGGASRPMLEGGSDAIAGAALQQAVGDMAAAAGAPVTSAELLPATAVDRYRRISLHVTASTTAPKLIALLSAVSQATPNMLVDDLSLRPSSMLGGAGAQSLEASFTVIAFCAGTAAAR